MQNNSDKIRKTVIISILAAISFVLFMFPKFPLLAAFPWLDIDFSDVPALFATIVVSPLAGLCVVLIKNVIHLAVTSTAMIGELSNFLINGSFVFTAGLIYKYVMKKNSKMFAVAISVIGGAIMQIIFSVLVNYYIMVPMYSAFVNFSELGGAKYYIVAGVIPFNIIKDIFSTVAFFVIYRLIGKKIHKILAK